MSAIRIPYLSKYCESPRKRNPSKTQHGELSTWFLLRRVSFGKILTLENPPSHSKPPIPMKKQIKTILSTMLVFVGILSTMKATTGSVITNTWISKSARYSQNGSNASNLVLDPQQPYNLLAWAQCAQNQATSIVSATLTLPGGSVQMFKALSLGSNTRGTIFSEFFTNASDMNALCPAGSNAIFNINILGKITSFTNVMGADIYPLAPLISCDSNGIWSSQGYITIQDPKKPFTISWPPALGLQSGITIYGFESFGGFQINNLSSNTFTFSTDLINQLPTGVVIPVLLNDWIGGAGGACFNNFAIFIPPTLFDGNPLTAFKTHTLLQTNRKSIIEYVPQVTPKGDYYGLGYGPYTFNVESPLSNSFTPPSNITYANRSHSGGYGYYSGAMSKSELDSQFANGNYTFSSGQILALTGDRYPNTNTPPQILTVNGKVPVWTNGMLRLSAGSPNNIVWSAFSGYSSFANCGLETIQFSPSGFADWGNISSSSGGGETNITICPAAGIGGSKLVTNIVLPARFLHTNVNYTMSIGYTALTSVTNQPCLSGAGYSTKTTILIIAK